MANKKVLVIAGNYHQYKEFLEKYNRKPEECEYVNTHVRLEYGNYSEALFIGDYWHNPTMRTLSRDGIKRAIAQANKCS
jgi:hypothetical protein